MLTNYSRLKTSEDIHTALDQALHNSEFLVAITAKTTAEQASLCLADIDRHSGLSFLIASAVKHHQQHNPKATVWFLSDKPRLNQTLIAELSFLKINASTLLGKNIDAAATELDDPEANADRLHILSKIASSTSHNSGLIITSHFDSPCPSPDDISQKGSSLSVGSEHDPELLTATLVNAGFEKVDHIHNRGQYALRGGILDVFTWQSPLPVRIEFFDTEIDSIREFDLNTQTSIRKVSQTNLHLTEPSDTATVANYIKETDLIITLNHQEKQNFLAKQRITYRSPLTR